MDSLVRNCAVSVDGDCVAPCDRWPKEAPSGYLLSMLPRWTSCTRVAYDDWSDEADHFLPHKVASI